MTTGRFRLPVFQGSILVFLADEAFHARVGLVDIGGDGRLDVLRVVDLVHDGVAVRSHTLSSLISLLNRPDRSEWLTSTCSAVQLSILNDLTLEIWVPSFRWRAAHRMQRKAPSCHRQLLFGTSNGEIQVSSSNVHSSLPSLKRKPLAYAIIIESIKPTWIRGLAIGAPIIARDGPDEIL